MVPNAETFFQSIRKISFHNSMISPLQHKSVANLG